VDRRPFYRTGEQVRVSTANLPKDAEDSKLSPRFIGPFKIMVRPGPNTYKVDFGDKFPGLSAHINVSDIRPYAQPSTTLRSGQDDEPLIGADERKPIEALTAQTRARGRPSRQTGPALQYKVKFKGLDCHHSVWLTEKVLRERYPLDIDRLLHEFRVQQA
jgi:hypothetical protein